MDESDLTVSAREILPSLKKSRSKGDNGIIAVFGGHRGYVGCTYFTGIGALRTGADMVYIFTSKEAEDVKMFSPDFIVQPIINDILFIENCHEWLKRSDVVVIGPGFRREKNNVGLFVSIVDACRALKKGLVIDSSGLNLLSKNLDIIKDFPQPGVILTPNGEEFKLLFGDAHEDYSKTVGNLGETITVLRKGAVDEAINFSKIVKFTGRGSNRRSIGQGDLLAGVAAAFFGFSIKYADTKKVSYSDLAIAACECASKLVRECNSRAFERKGRAMLTSDMIEEISGAFKHLFNDD